MQTQQKEYSSEYIENGLLVKPVAGVIGAEVEGLTLRDIDPSDSELIKTLRDLMLRHRVVFFRKQNLNPEEHLAFASLFGDPAPAHPYLPGMKEHPDIFEIDYTLGEDQYPDSANNAGTKYLNRGIAWHTDITFIDEPPAISVLNGVVIPYSGGDTMWCDMAAAFSNLSKKMQNMLRGCIAIHDGSEIQQVVEGRAGMDTLGCCMTTAKPPSKTRDEIGSEVVSMIQTGGPTIFKAKHPVVTLHPETGEEVLFVHQGFTRRITNYNKAESDSLLKFLYDWATKYEFTVRHRWTQGDIALADNRITQHAVVGDIGRSARVINRITLKGSKPIAAPQK